MTVAELIAELQKLPQDAKVFDPNTGDYYRPRDMWVSPKGNVALGTTYGLHDAFGGNK